ncbi:MAG: hypothetical protein J6C82_04925 [Clostridia bacterium]|nr:hypothetical protein [Clostridia bacterium]
MIKRSDKKAFYGIPAEGTGEPTFTRMKYFTELAISKNPAEYTRQYTDEDTERTDVVRYSPSMSFNFDDYEGDAVLTDIVSIINDERLGTDAQREIILVDFSKPTDTGYEAYRRTFSVIADSEGDSMDAYTYSGTFKAVGKKVKGVAVIATPENGDSESVTTITFTELSE